MNCTGRADRLNITMARSPTSLHRSHSLAKCSSRTVRCSACISDRHGSCACSHSVRFCWNASIDRSRRRLRSARPTAM